MSTSPLAVLGGGHGQGRKVKTRTGSKGTSGCSNLAYQGFPHQSAMPGRSRGGWVLNNRILKFKAQLVADIAKVNILQWFPCIMPVPNLSQDQVSVKHSIRAYTLGW